MSGVVFGLAPAFTATHGSVSGVLRSAGCHHTASRWRQRQRTAIVAGQMAIAVLLLAGGGLLVRSYAKLLEVDPGFRAEKVLTMGIALPSSSYHQDSTKITFQKQLLEKVSQVPGVARAGMTSFLPASGQDSRMGLIVEGIAPDPREPRRANWRLVTPGYFETMQIGLRPRPVICGKRS